MITEEYSKDDNNNHTNNNNNNNTVVYEDGENNNIRELIKSKDFRVKLMINILNFRNHHHHNGQSQEQEVEEDEEDENDTLYEKLFDRFNRLLSDANDTLDIIKNYNLFNIVKQCCLEPNNHVAPQIKAINIKVLALLLRHDMVFGFIKQIDGESLNLILANRIFTGFMVNQDPLVRDSTIKSIQMMFSNSNLFRDYLYGNINLFSIVLDNIFKSFLYPSNFVARSSINLLFNIISLLTMEQYPKYSILIEVTKRIDKGLVIGEGNDLESIELCILDLFVMLVIKNQAGCKYIMDNQFIEKSFLLVLNNDRMVKERTLELFTVILDKNNYNNNNLLIYLSKFENLIIETINQLLKSNKKDLVSTGIDLISIFESTFLRSGQIFNNCIEIIDSITGFENHNLSNIQAIKSDSIIFSLINCTKNILKKNREFKFPDDWIQFIFNVSIQKLPFGSVTISTKTQKESIDTIQYFNSMIFKQMLRVSPTPYQYFLQETLKSQATNIVKQALSTFLMVYKNQNNNESISIINIINRLLLNQSSEIREVGLSFLAQVFNSSDQQYYSLIAKLLLEENVVPMVFKKLVDADSYVRSSALEVIKVLSMTKEGWEYLINGSKENDISLDKLNIVNDNQPTKTINEEIMNHNQINLQKYTDMIKKEYQQHHQQQQYISYDNLSICGSFHTIDSDEGKSVHDGEDFEWDDEEFKELLERTQNDGSSYNESFMEEEDEMKDQPTYPFPYSILLFFSDVELYPRLSAIELFTIWIDLAHTRTFIHQLMDDKQVNDKYQFNHLMYRLMNDSNWNVKLNTIKLFKQIHNNAHYNLESLQTINAIELLVGNAKNELEDHIIRVESLQCLLGIQGEAIKIIHGFDVRELLGQLLQTRQTEFSEDEEEDIYLYKCLRSTKDKINLDCF